MIAKYLVRVCQGKKIKFDRKLKAFLSEDMIQRLHDFEENCFYIYRCELEDLTDNQLEEKVKHTRNKVESISARIDDIFFKESMTKLSLYKVELRLQKLEEFSYETIGVLNNLCNLMRANSGLNKSGNSSNKVDSKEQQTTFLERPRNMSLRHRHNTTNDSSYYTHVANQMLSRQLSRSSVRAHRSNSTNTEDIQNNMIFNSWEGRDKVEQATRDNLREESPSGENAYGSEQDMVSKEVKCRRKKAPSESQSQSAVVLRQTSRASKVVANKNSKLDKNSDNEDATASNSGRLNKNGLLNAGNRESLEEDATEAKYFEQFSKKLANRSNKRMSESNSSSSQSLAKENKSERKSVNIKNLILFF